jgi:hypothetical protein
MMPLVSESPQLLISRLLHNVAPADRDTYLNLSYMNFPAGYPSRRSRTCNISDKRDDRWR